MDKYTGKANLSALRLQQHFEEQVQPYLKIVETIALQNQIIQELQIKCQKLHQKKNELKTKPISNQALEQLRKTRQIQAKHQRNTFLEEGLIVGQQRFQQLHSARKAQLLEEIGLKYDQVLALRKNKGNSHNLFMNLQEDLLSQVLQDLNESGEADQTRQVAHWQNIYKERSEAYRK